MFFFAISKWGWLLIVFLLKNMKYLIKKVKDNLMSNLNYIMNYLGRFKKKTKFNYLFNGKIKQENS